MANPKITFIQKSKSTDNTSSSIEFLTWQGRPQYARPILDKTTRLGGNQLVMSIQKTEAVTTSSTATIGGSSIAEIEEKIQRLQENIGTRAIWTDEASNTINNFYIIDVNYNITAVLGAYNYIAVLNILCTTDEAPISKKQTK